MSSSGLSSVTRLKRVTVAVEYAPFGNVKLQDKTQHTVLFFFASPNWLHFSQPRAEVKRHAVATSGAKEEEHLLHLIAEQALFQCLQLLIISSCFVSVCLRSIIVLPIHR
jgi:hypothetical protein